MHVRFSPAREASRAGLLLIGGVKELSVIRSRQSDRSEVQTAATTDFLYTSRPIDSCIVCAGRQERREEGMLFGMFGSLCLEVNRDEYNSVNNGRRTRRTFLA